MNAKARLSAYMCTNATGTSELPPMAVIGRAKEPRCFCGKTVPCVYYSQTNA